jgi:hypothetical protein
MMRAIKRGRALGAAITLIALLIYALAPVVHGFIHPDHEIRAALSADDGAPMPKHHKSPAQSPDQDCALFKLYAGANGHAVPAPSPDLAPQLLVFADAAPLLRISPLPAGAPRGFALGRGPPHLA